MGPLDDCVAIVCSRQKSSRVEEKPFVRIAGVRVIDHILHRLNRLGVHIVLAVPVGEGRAYAEASEYRGPKIIYEGDKNSPLHRMADYLRSIAFRPKWTIRVTHDDILTDEQSIMDLLDACDGQNADYGYMPGIARGMDAEVIRTETLMAAADKIRIPVEHVSYFVKGEKQVKLSPRESINRKYRLTFDYPKDGILLNVILRELGPFVSNDEICAFIDRHMYLMNLNSLPLITFYTCVHNNVKHISQTMESVIRVGDDLIRDYYEYIVVDDFSTDGTLTEIVKNIPASKGCINLCLNESNIGLSSSCNIALEKAKARYVMRIDADDYLLRSDYQEYLTMMDLLDQGNAAVYPSYQRVDLMGHVYGEKCCDPWDGYHIGGALFDKNVMNELRFRDGLRNWDSLDIKNRLDKLGLKVATLPNVTWAYRLNPGSLSNTNSDLRKRERELVDKS